MSEQKPVSTVDAHLLLKHLQTERDAHAVIRENSKGVARTIHKAKEEALHWAIGMVRAFMTIEDTAK